jgi:hypothetical protein
MRGMGTSLSHAGRERNCRRRQDSHGAVCAKTLVLMEGLQNPWTMASRAGPRKCGRPAHGICIAHTYCINLGMGNTACRLWKPVFILIRPTTSLHRPEITGLSYFATCLRRVPVHHQPLDGESATRRSTHRQHSHARLVISPFFPSTNCAQQLKPVSSRARCDIRQRRRTTMRRH